MPKGHYLEGKKAKSICRGAQLGIKAHYQENDDFKFFTKDSKVTWSPSNVVKAVNHVHRVGKTQTILDKYDGVDSPDTAWEQYRIEKNGVTETNDTYGLYGWMLYIMITILKVSIIIF